MDAAEVEEHLFSIGEPKVQQPFFNSDFKFSIENLFFALFFQGIADDLKFLCISCLFEVFLNLGVPTKLY